MAYRHNNNDPYHNNQQQQQQYSNNPQQQYGAYNSNTGVASYEPKPAQGYRNDYDASNWDTKSYQSSYAGSQAHLNPYEMAQVNVAAPPVPQMPYAPTSPSYPPPQQRPGLYQASSSAGWSVAREKLMKRRSIKQVQLVNGNLVLDMPVPTHIVPSGKTDEEFTKMRYTAATCDPDDFMASRYSLRQYLSGRQTELFIVMTMYNEDEVLFVRTMNA